MNELHAVNPVRAARSQLARFAQAASERTGHPLRDYTALHAFSVDSPEVFWGLLVQQAAVVAGGELEPVRVGADVRTARFFPAMRVSWAENVLAERTPAEEQGIAIIGCDESGRRTEISRQDLRRRVRAVASGLAARGLRRGDRVAAVARNTIDTAVACLAVTALGATWSSVAPDMGPQAALSRFRQLEPNLLFVHPRTWLGGIRLDVPVRALATGLPSLTGVVLLDDAATAGWPDDVQLPVLERQGEASGATRPWERVPFDHPLFVLFSSGTTGTPKGIVHGHGGTLLEHAKEHRLHCDLGPGDRLLFQTTTGWMMWNWTLSALATGATLVLYDGSVSHPEPDALLRVVSRERVTVLGLSPAYLRYLMDGGVAPRLGGDLREILCTGSVLPASLHRWAKENVADVPLQSISGGTDIVGCFVMGSPWTPTYPGESSCIGLGMDVRAWNGDGASVRGRGELVCTNPFPSRPVGLLGDGDGKRLHDAYFAQHAGVWTHGDLVELTSRERCTAARVLGRCDGVMNIRGIRIGPGEIYEVLSTAVPEVAQAMAVDQESPDEPGGKRLVLFVITRAGILLDRPLAFRIKRELKTRASPAHVPAVIVQVADLPLTHSGKLSEAALQDALSGRPVRNLEALRNPETIEGALEALRREAQAGSRAASPAAE
jgi:acetoacetyl-CoA synthetase